MPNTTIHPLDPELAGDQIDLARVNDLEKLAQIATENTTRVRDLQRLQAKLIDQKSDTTEIGALILNRQHRGTRLSRRREELKKIARENLLVEMQTLLNPTTVALNNERRSVIDSLISLREKAIKMKKSVDKLEQDIEQRRLSACLYQWDRKLVVVISEIENLKNLPQNLEF